MANATTAWVQDIQGLHCVVKEVLSDVSCARSKVSRFKQILEEYQEQPQLLDPHLHDLVRPLAQLISDSLNILNDAGHFLHIMHVCRLLQILVSARGYKTVAHLLPNRPTDFERALLLLRHARSLLPDSCVDEDRQDGRWQTCYVALLWVAALAVMPFDLCTLQTGTFEECANSQPIPWLINVGRTYLSDPSPCRDMAAIMLSKLVTRKDMQHHMQGLQRQFWSDMSTDYLERSAEDATWVFMLPGILATLANMFCVGSREVMLQYSEAAWTHASSLVSLKGLKKSTLARKMVMKVLQRCALALLDPTNVNASALAVRAQATKKMIKGTTSAASERLSLTSVGMRILPSVIDSLLQGLRDMETVVRWSAAKGIGRIAERLPAVCIEDVNDALLELFSPTESDAAWHGACLALAEIARRGLLPEARLPQVIPLVVSALHYDHRRGSFSIGQHVRDAAAYVCWAFARVYRADTMMSVLPLLTPALLAAACYDREVNCRRAASAAFQEAVGRLGAQNFPHGIEILTSADYFALGSRREAFLEIGPAIAALPPNCNPLAEHLLLQKLGNWDIAVRDLAANALGRLVYLDPPYFRTRALTYAISRATDAQTVEDRHGAALAVAALVAALHENGNVLCANEQRAVIELALQLHSGGLCRGKGGELMRAACCQIVCAISATRMQLSSDKAIQKAAGQALACFLSAYGDLTDLQVVLRYRQGLVSALPEVRLGSGIAIASLPFPILASMREGLLHDVCRASDFNWATDVRDVDARVAAIDAMAHIVQESCCLGPVECVGSTEHSHRQDHDFLEQAMQHSVFPTLARCFDDYTTDNRGDVGSLVREKAMVTSLRVLHLVLADPSFHSNFQFNKIVIATVANLLKQAVERIQRTRMVALSTMRNILDLLAQSDVGVHPPAYKQLLTLLGPQAAQKEAGVLMQHVTVFTLWREYRTRILEGLVACIGGVDVRLRETCANALVCLMRGRSYSAVALIDTEGSTALTDESLCESLLEVWRLHAISSRLATPILQTFDYLLQRGALRLSKLQAHQSQALLDCVRSEGRNTKDLQRLRGVLAVLAHYAEGAFRAQQKEALQAMMVLLASRVPKLRQSAAEALFMTLTLIRSRLMTSTESKGIWTASALQRVHGTLLAVCWDSDNIAAIKAARTTIMVALQLQPPTCKVTVALTSDGRRQDGNLYQGLVDDFTRNIR